MTTNVDELIEFLGIIEEQGFLNDNTAVARRTACKKLFDILDPEQRTVEYVRDNLAVIKTRFSNLNKEVRGGTVDEYARRAQLVIDEFTKWKADRAAWEREQASKQNARPAGDGEKKSKPKAEKARSQSNGSTPAASVNNNPDARVVTFPIRSDFDLQVSLPREGLTVPELKKLVYFLLPYAPDWEPTESPRSVFSMLEQHD